MISKYLKTEYERGGRGPEKYDCWGLVRAVHHELFNRPLLPSYGAICPTNKAGLTKACADVKESGRFIEVASQPGAIATAWRASLCVHVGICVLVDGRLWVLETDEPDGPVLSSQSAFESRYSKVIYYDN